MDKYPEAILNMQLERTAHALEHNGIQSFVVSDSAQVSPLIQTLLKPGDTVSFGGSETLRQCGVLSLLRSGSYRLLDRSEPGLTSAQIEEIYRNSFSADAYFCSANAITEQGEIYNVDGYGNRIAAIAFGPKSVIMVVGANKIVRNLKEAQLRVKSIAAPANCLRLSKETYCSKCGQCSSLVTGNREMTAGCDSADRICSSYLILGKQQRKGRIKVILVAQTLGF